MKDTTSLTIEQLYILIEEYSQLFKNAAPDKHMVNALADLFNYKVEISTDLLQMFAALIGR